MKAEEIKALAFDEAPNDIVRALCMSWCFSKHIPQNAEQHRAAVLEPAIKQAIDAASEVDRLRARVAELEAKSTQDSADAERFRWILNGHGYFMEEWGLCGHGPCDDEEKDHARRVIDDVIAGRR